MLVLVASTDEGEVAGGWWLSAPIFISLYTILQTVASEGCVGNVHAPLFLSVVYEKWRLIFVLPPLLQSGHSLIRLSLA